MERDEKREREEQEFEIKQKKQSEKICLPGDWDYSAVQSKLKFKVGGWWQVLVYIQQAENIKHFIAKKTFYYSAKFSSQRLNNKQSRYVPSTSQVKLGPPT